MAEGQNYQDTLQPFQTADFAAVTLSTTSKSLWPVPENTPRPTTAWWPGKKMKLVVFGRATTGATPGNITIELRAATADNAGVIIATSTAIALTANKTNISWTAKWYIECRANSPAASGSLFAWGKFIPNQLGLLIPAANNPLIIPESAPAATTVDLTTAANQGLSMQVKRSGSTAETMQVHDLHMVALN